MALEAKIGTVSTFSGIVKENGLIAFSGFKNGIKTFTVRPSRKSHVAVVEIGVTVVLKSKTPAKKVTFTLISADTSETLAKLNPVDGNDLTFSQQISVPIHVQERIKKFSVAIRSDAHVEISSALFTLKNLN